MYIRDTIAAIATPVGEGGIGIIRISGSEAGSVLRSIFRREKGGGFNSHRFYYGEIFDPATGGVIDEGMAVLMLSPKSYTREDVAEIHSHGGRLIVEKVLGLVVRHGARLAEPGEFTKRAFLNGRIDLVQAQAVMDIISSRTELSLDVAQRQRKGELSAKIALLKQTVVHALAFVEAHIDFPEEDLGVDEIRQIRHDVGNAAWGMTALLESYDEGKALREGVSVLIAGKPNVGKSSLLNILLKEERAIVTHLPGTTRDTIEETINLSGLPVRLMDTAGIRHTEDLVEKEGVRIALEKVADADLILFVIDGSRPLDCEDLSILEHLSGKDVIVVVNKSDLPAVAEVPDELRAAKSVHISSKTGEGVDLLRAAVYSTFLHGEAKDIRDFVAVTHVRERDILTRSREHLNDFIQHLAEGLDPELLAVDLRLALESLGEVTGETTPDEILDVIFSRFCIGK